RTRIANLNLQADAAHRVRQDSDVTLIGGAASNHAELSDDSETEGEGDSKRKSVEAEQAENEVNANNRSAVVVETEVTPGKQEKKGKGRKSVKDKMAKFSFTTFTGYVPKKRGPEFVIYPF